MRYFPIIEPPLYHASREGTFVTNTSGRDTEEITASVEAFGDPEIFMKGKEMHNTRKPCDLSDFWAAHKKRISHFKSHDTTPTNLDHT